jgi:hypothetical protein
LRGNAKVESEAIDAIIEHAQLLALGKNPEATGCFHPASILPPGKSSRGFQEIKSLKDHSLCHILGKTKNGITSALPIEVFGQVVYW